MEESCARGSIVSWREPAAATLVVLMLVAAALHQGLAGEHAAVAPAARAAGYSQRGLSSLPLTAQGPLSASLGVVDPAYLISAANGELAGTNPAQGLSLRFSRGGVSLRSGATHVGLSVRAIGYGSTLRTLGQRAPRPRANRVVYARAGLSEWYVNGPLGLEQGFTIPAAPGHAPGALTLALELSGNARARLGAGGQSVTLSHTGGPALRYGDLYVTDAHGRLLHSWLALDAGLLLIRVDARDARYPLRIDPFIQQGARLTASGGSVSFGRSVALSGDGQTAVIGDPTEDGVGAAWVFTRSGSTWTEGEKLTGAGESGDGEFGASVALSGDGQTALIGGPDDGGHAGAAWVFTRSGSSWAQQGEKLTGGEESGDGEFGSSVALSSEGDTALIGGANDDNPGIGAQGAAWVFTRSGSSWAQQGGKLTPAGGCGTPLFGTSVALSAEGNTALVGAPLDCDVGAVWVFTRAGSSWTQQGGKLTASGETGKGWFGESVALSGDGDTALIGGGYDNGYLGAAWVFTRSGSAWAQQGGKLTGGGACPTALFGTSVALSAEGNIALIGGPESCDEGAAWVFTRSGSSWTAQGEALTGSGESSEGRYGLDRAGFGRSVALSAEGDVALIGGGRVSELLGAAWSFVQEPTASPNPAEYGRCVKVPQVTGEDYRGRYANADCTELSAKGSYEWYRGLARTHFTSRTAKGSATFETAKGAKLACRAETGTGEYSGPGLTTVADVVLAFSGCERLGAKCSSAQAAGGEIVSAQLEGVLGIAALGHTSAKDKLGLELFPAGKAGPLMQFSCGATTAAVRGSLIATVVSAGRMGLTSRLAYSAAKGRQKPEGFIGAQRAVLEASFDGEPYEQMGLKLTITQTNEEEAEVNSALWRRRASSAHKRKRRRRR